MTAVPLKLIVGLGNPGEDYERTRHNIGFWLVDELARRHGGERGPARPSRTARLLGLFRTEPKHQAELVRIRVSGEEVWLMKPQSYMNRSGDPVASVAHFYKVSAGEILVAYDELDFPPGVARLKLGGGAAGHNGVRDIAAHIGSEFWRLRIGIGRPNARGQGSDHVLGRASGEDERLIRDTIAAAADTIPVLMQEGAQKAMNFLHSRDAPPQS
ncbi:MAG TPA: aminoacyl-tRNA hydrolase [Steroidobacteraceae bacterium]|jgi:PTH1 family peptidyl-tRNA hydrolase|nr:aminoacyl-tRNA hydrolase [Steroidobacteraceae bacterium]